MKNKYVLFAFFILAKKLSLAQNWDQIIKAAAGDRGQTYINNRDVGNQFGFEVAISGDYAIVGSNLQHGDAGGGATSLYNGAAYVFTKIGNTWVQQQKLTASDGSAYDQFGSSVAISGDYAIIGALYDAQGVNPGDSSVFSAGSAYIFKRTGSTWTQQQKIVASDRGSDDRFGWTVGISGDYIVVGNFRDDEDVNGGSYLLNAGSAYVFVRSGNTWSQQQKIVAADRGDSDNFAYRVAIDGDYIIVGAPFEQHDVSGGSAVLGAGSAYIYVRSGTTWTQQQKIVASDRGGTTYDNFGWDVDISGDYAVVGARTDDQDASGGAFKQDAGSAYVFVRSGTTWTQQQKLVSSDRGAQDRFGWSVAISGDYIAVGATTESHNATGGDSLDGAGSAYIFVRSGSVWSQQQKIVASDRQSVDQFGYAVEMDGLNAIVGAVVEDHDEFSLDSVRNAGSTYIFERSGSNWTQQVKVVPQGPSFTTTGLDDFFGYSVSIHGNYAIVGAFQEDEDSSANNMLNESGSAYIFTRSGGSWALQQKLVASDRGRRDRFGASVAIYGDYAIVGAYSEDENASGSASATDAGSAYIFTRSGNNWIQQQKIVASDRASGDNFGWSVAINGDYAIVGAPQEDEDASGNSTAASAGSAYIFVRSGNSWTQQQKMVASDRQAGDNFGFSVSISGNYAIIGANQEDEDASGAATADSAGSAYIFVRSGSNWTQQQKIVASDRGRADQFGTSVGISGDYAIVGAYLEDHNTTGIDSLSASGSAYIYYRTGSSWSQQQKLIASDRSPSDQFGISVAISGRYAIVGAHFEDEDTSGGATLLNAGSAYVFERTGASWIQQQKIVSSDRATEDNFGYSVSIDGSHAIAGAYKDDEDASGANTLANTGSVYFYYKTPPPPVISSFTPDSGCGGSTSITISGAYFTDATSVTIGGTAVSSFVVNSSSEISVIAGIGTTGKIQVTTPDGTASSTDTFFVSIPATVNAGSDLGMCAGTPITINSASQNNALPLSWALLNPASGATITSGNTIAPTISINSPSSVSGPNQIFTLRLTSADPDGAGPCPAVSDDVNIQVDALPPVADAGTDIFDCSSALDLTMAASPIAYGEGTWSGSALFGNVHSASSTASVAASGTYTFTWSTINGLCTTPNTDQVNVAYNNPGPITMIDGATGVCIVNDNGWHHFFDAAGNAILSINSYGQNLGTVNVMVNVGEPSEIANNAGAGHCVNSYTAYMGRSFVIEPDSQPTSPVSVRLYFTGSEFDSLSSASSANNNGDQCDTDDDISSISQIMVSKYSAGSGPGGSGIAIVPVGNGTAFGGSYVEFTSGSFSRFFLHGSNSNSPLPVEWLYFKTASVENRFIRLEWATAVELNNAGFVVERSTDAQNWIELGMLSANEQKASQNVYRFDDYKTVLGVVYYYRLKQIDRDGNFEWSEVKTGMLSGSLELAFNDLIPNPANERCDLLLSASEAAEAEVFISNAMGQLMYSKRIMLSEGSNELAIDLSGFSGGAYTVRVNSSGIIFSKKLIVAK
jgi:hypothetical protein